MSDFKSFDFEADDNWKSYFRNVEIPGDASEAVILRLKAKWYKKNIDPDFDVSQTAPPPQSSKPAEPPRQPTTKSASGTHASTSAPSPPSSETRSQPKPAAASYASSDDRHQLRLFVLHVGFLLASVVFLITPFKPALSYYAYKMAIQVAVMMHLYKVYIKFGRPALTFASIKQYFVNILPTTDLQYACMGLLFMSHRPYMMVLVPYVVLAVYHTMAYLAGRMREHALWKRYGAKAHALLMSKQRQALAVNAAAEIGMGFILLLQMLSAQRNLVLLIMYWNTLRIRYRTPDAAPYHAQVWRIIDQQTLSYRLRLPILQTIIGYAQRIFLAER